MKNIIIALLFLSLCLLGCKKKNQGEAPSNYKYGTVSSLQVDGKFFLKPKWSISALARKSDLCGNDFTLTIEQKASDSFENEKIHISNISLDKLGVSNVSYSIKACDSIPKSSFYLGDGDLIWYSYYPLKSQKNTVTLLDYNKTTNEVSGTFDITFVIQFGTPDSRLIYPDTIRFHDGQFKTFLND